MMTAVITWQAVGGIASAVAAVGALGAILFAYKTVGLARDTLNEAKRQRLLDQLSVLSRSVSEMHATHTGVPQSDERPLARERLLMELGVWTMLGGQDLPKCQVVARGVGSADAGLAAHEELRDALLDDEVAR